MSNISITVKLAGDRKVTIATDALGDDALVSAVAAFNAKRRDSDAGQDADLILGEAKPILATEARRHLRDACNSKNDDGTINWTLRAAHMKRSGALYRGIK